MCNAPFVPCNPFNTFCTTCVPVNELSTGDGTEPNSVEEVVGKENGVAAEEVNNEALNLRYN